VNLLAAVPAGAVVPVASFEFAWVSRPAVWRQQITFPKKITLNGRLFCGCSCLGCTSFILNPYSYCFVDSKPKTTTHSGTTLFNRQQFVGTAPFYNETNRCKRLSGKVFQL
jgi:hypothetical protein